MDGSRSLAYCYNETRRYRRPPTCNTTVPAPSQQVRATVPPPALSPKPEQVSNRIWLQRGPGTAKRETKVQLHTKPPAPTETHTQTDNKLNRKGNDYVRDPCWHGTSRYNRFTDLVFQQPTTRHTPPEPGKVIREQPSPHVPEVEKITCEQCGYCKCGSCATERKLPSVPCCDKKYECGAKQCVNWASCMCILDSIFYHGCYEPHESSEESCSCEKPNCCIRWTCILGVLPCLPCLFCYWPLRGCVCLCTKCYNVAKRRERCRCTQQNSKLIDSENSSV